MFMSVSLQAAVHLGNDYAENLHSIKNQPKRTLKQLFNVTEKLIRDQKNISGIPVINWQQLVWQRRTVHTDNAVQFATAKTYVISSGQPPKRMEGEDWLVYEFTSIQRIGTNRRGADGVRVEFFPADPC